MKKLYVFALCSFGAIAAAQAGKRAASIDYSSFDVTGQPMPLEWNYEASQTCPFDDWDLKPLSTYCYYYYPDLYWTAKSGYEEWGWTYQDTRWWLQREAYVYYKAANPGYDDPVETQ